jgi:hypothetical protein
MSSVSSDIMIHACTIGGFREIFAGGRMPDKNSLVYVYCCSVFHYYIPNYWFQSQDTAVYTLDIIHSI